MDTTPSRTDSVSETLEPLFSQEEEPSAAVSEDAALGEQEMADDALAPEDEIEDELIIEDFTIDGICGVY
ncbi:MAG TPA: mycofactocin precursor MftA [Ktedonobacteraceae bacterium]|nr:mycofactocin precursor MftA [Ktedonobacteraceae bacterium]